MLSYSRQTIEADDIESVLRVLTADFLTCGPEVSELEKEIAAYCGSRFAVVCSNGTAGLHLAALALDLRPGQSLFTSPITFLASANCARYCGAEVEFIDVDPQSLGIVPAQLERAVVSSRYRPRAVVPVHYGGAVADLAGVAAVAKRHGLFVIEDACHAIGSTYSDPLSGKTVRVGSCEHSDLTVFSFHPLKHITTGEGGAITTNDEKLYQRLLRLRSHGIEREQGKWATKEQGFCDAQPNPWYHEMQELGFNYRLTDIQCALGRSQLRKLDRFINARRRLADTYRTLLKETTSAAQPVFAQPGTGNSYHLFPVRIPFEELGTSRGEVMRKLAQAGISTQVHYIPVYRQPYYREKYAYAPDAFPNAERYYAQALSLPLYPMLTDHDLIQVVETLNRIL